MAYQALEVSLKLEKVPSNKVPLQISSLLIKKKSSSLVSGPIMSSSVQNMEQDELEQYWTKPFVVKSHLGYWTWPKESAHVPLRRRTQRHPTR